MLEKILEEQIQRAMAEGQFDNLKGAGRPLDLDDYFATPAEIRAAYKLLKNNEFVPEEIGLMKDIGDLKERLRMSQDEEEKKRLTKELNEKSMALSIILERNKRR